MIIQWHNTRVGTDHLNIQTNIYRIGMLSPCMAEIISDAFTYTCKGLPFMVFEVSSIFTSQHFFLV